MTDAETIAALQAMLASREAEIERLRGELSRCAWFTISLDDLPTETPPEKPNDEG